MSAGRRGLVAVGDSITRGSGDSMLGLRMQSWALWTAEALAMPYTCLAADGASAADALALQVPRLRGPYDLGCVYLGVNDVRTPGFDPARFETALRRVASAVAAVADLLLLVELPASLGVPSAPEAQIARANMAIVRLAHELGAVHVTAGGVRGDELVLPDRVHLTARGQALLALRACERLRERGLEADTGLLERELLPLTRAQRARWLLGAHAVSRARDWRRRVLEAAERAR